MRTRNPSCLTRANRPRQSAGFSLIEMMISITISGVVLGAIMTSFIQNRSIYDTSKLKNETLQNSRSSLDQMSRDIRSAGYGMALGDYRIDEWVTWIDGIDSNPFVADGGGKQPDSVHLVGAFDLPVARTKHAAEPGDTALDIRLLTEAIPFNSTNHFLVYIGKVELARVVRFTSDSLVISTDPYADDVGLRHRYAKKTPIELISTVQYRIEHDGDMPYLARLYSRENQSDPLLNLCAMNIENLQLRRTDDYIDIHIVARSMNELLRHKDPTSHDHWVRHDIQSRVVSRNRTPATGSVPSAGF